MAIGAGLIALSSVSRNEHAQWQEAAAREDERYGVDPNYTAARIAGTNPDTTVRRRRSIDWLIVGFATAVIVGFALTAHAPEISVRGEWAAVLLTCTLAMMVVAGTALWRTTRFN
jgi:hypothetical protein